MFCRCHLECHIVTLCEQTHILNHGIIRVVRWQLSLSHHHHHNRFKAVLHVNNKIQFSLYVSASVWLTFKMKVK